MTVYDQIRDDIRARAEHAEQIASPQAVAAREAAYDRLCPNWRHSGSYLIRLGSAYLERNPYFGDWRWTGSSQFASRFTLDGAAAMMTRVEAAGIADAYVYGSIASAERGLPNVTAADIAFGDIAPKPNAFERSVDVVR